MRHSTGIHELNDVPNVQKFDLDNTTLHEAEATRILGKLDEVIKGMLHKRTGHTNSDFYLESYNKLSESEKIRLSDIDNGTDPAATQAIGETLGDPRMKVVMMMLAKEDSFFDELDICFVKPDDYGNIQCQRLGVKTTSESPNAPPRVVTMLQAGSGYYIPLRAPKLNTAMPEPRKPVIKPVIDPSQVDMINLQFKKIIGQLDVGIDGAEQRKTVSEQLNDVFATFKKGINRSKGEDLGSAIEKCQKTIELVDPQPPATTWTNYLFSFVVNTQQEPLSAAKEKFVKELKVLKAWLEEGVNATLKPDHPLVLEENARTLEHCGIENFDFQVYSKGLRLQDQVQQEIVTLTDEVSALLPQDAATIRSSINVENKKPDTEKLSRKANDNYKTAEINAQEIFDNIEVNKFLEQFCENVVENINYNIDKKTLELYEGLSKKIEDARKGFSRPGIDKLKYRRELKTKISKNIAQLESDPKFIKFEQCRSYKNDLSKAIEKIEKINNHKQTLTAVKAITGLINNPEFTKTDSIGEKVRKREDTQKELKPNFDIIRINIAQDVQFETMRNNTASTPATATP